MLMQERDDLLILQTLGPDIVADLPNRDDANTGPSPRRCALAAEISRSHISFDVPITLVGFTTLSVELNSTRFPAHGLLTPSSPSAGIDSGHHTSFSSVSFPS